MTAQTAGRLILVLGLALVPLSARADCHDDLASLSARLAAANQTAPNVLAAKKDLAKAQKNEQDEIACSNWAARGWRAYRTPPPQAADAQQ